MKHFPILLFTTVMLFLIVFFTSVSVYQNGSKTAEKLMLDKCQGDLK